MTGSHDDLFDRLHAAADSVPPSTLDLPVVLVTSRRKATARRAVAGTAVLTACAVLGVGVASGLPGRVAHDLVPAATYETLRTEIVHREVAPGITAVAEAATYELPDESVVLDTGIETGAHGDRFLIVSTVELSAGGSVEPVDRDDPETIGWMADLGYGPVENQRIQVIAGDDAELRRLRGGAGPTTVVVSTLGSAAVVDTEEGRFVFGTTVSERVDDARTTSVPSWDPFTQADGTAGTSLLVPTLTIPQRARVPFALALTKETSFAPVTAASFTDDRSATGPCTERVDGCAVSYDTRSRVAIQSQVEDPRWAAFLESFPNEDVSVLDTSGDIVLFQCQASWDATDWSFSEHLSAEDEDRIVAATAGLTYCMVERSPTSDGGLRVGS
ncbi:hypothetical protein ACFRCR_09650 [Oerskovia sp. NPDC056781]|uniref:hypothetical protein n=1 Tax=Oerskovia sp. NPDC056781 TaxID=3345942 RepID=UPI00366BF733